jgi:hypothetical protein
MNVYLVSAAILAILVAVAHSVLGEVMIFRRLRTGGIIPTNGGGLLRESNVRILWASWHVLSVFGIGIAAVLLWLSQPSAGSVPQAFVRGAFAAAMLSGSALVLVATRARHPGWIGLLGVAVLIWLSSAN